jgi:hypothetical protein
MKIRIEFDNELIEIVGVEKLNKENQDSLGFLLEMFFKTNVSQNVKLLLTEMDKY